MFDWDEGNVAHIALHGVSREEAEEVLANKPLDLGSEVRNGEERVAHLGETSAGRILLVVVRVRLGRIRVVTAFTPNRQLRQFYANQKVGGSAQDAGHT